MIECIVVIVETPFSKRDYDRYGIEVFRRNGLDPLVLDLTKYLHPNINPAVAGEAVEFNGLMRIESRSQLEQLLQRLPITCFVYSTLHVTPKTLWLYRWISRYKFPYGVNSISVLPTLPSRARSLALPRILSLRPAKLLSLFIKLAPLKMLGVRPADLVIVHGEKSVIRRKEVLASTRLVHMHSFDYDLCMRLIENGKPVESQTAVFLDAFLPFHPDYLYLKSQKLADLPDGIDTDKYYAQLDTFFRQVEDKTKLKIIIAAHPRSNYEKLPNYYRGRLVIKDRTAELVNSARLVILEQSTSINFSVILKKPMLFITSNQLQRQPYGEFTEYMASLFNRRPVNINTTWQPDAALFDVDKTLYHAYQQQYIKNEQSERMESWQIFANEIHRLGGN